MNRHPTIYQPRNIIGTPYFKDPAEIDRDKPMQITGRVTDDRQRRNRGETARYGDIRVVR